LKNKNWKDRKFIYGLPELHREKIRKARNIVNPGCFATGIQLGLLPLAKAGLLKEEIYTTGITGSTGAEQTLSTTPELSRRVSNIQAYKTLAYQHMKEINQSMALIKAPDTIINFVPWRGDFTRGIFLSSMLTC